MNLNKLLASEQCNPLTPERELELGEQYKIALEENDLDAISKIKNELIMRHLRMILYIGKGYKHILDRDEIISVGSLALTHCVTNWNPDKGQMYGWAERWITTALTRAADATRSIRIPQGVAYKAGLIQKQINMMQDELGRELTKEEKEAIADGTQTFDSLPIVSDSLDRSVKFDSGSDFKTLGDTIEDIDSDPSEIVEKNEKLIGIKLAIEELTDMEQRVIKCRFGIDNEHRLTLAQLGEKYGVTGEAMRRIEATALAKLRHPSIKNPLESL